MLAVRDFVRLYHSTDSSTGSSASTQGFQVVQGAEIPRQPTFELQLGVLNRVGLNLIRKVRHRIADQERRGLSKLVYCQSYVSVSAGSLRFLTEGVYYDPRFDE